MSTLIGPHFEQYLKATTTHNSNMFMLIWTIHDLGCLQDYTTSICTITPFLTFILITCPMFNELMSCPRWAQEQLDMCTPYFDCL